MILTVELPEEVANELKLLSDKDLRFYQEGIRQHATDEARKLAAMTPQEREEYEDTCSAIEESAAQFQRGQYMTMEQAKERSRQEIELEKTLSIRGL